MAGAGRLLYLLGSSLLPRRSDPVERESRPIEHMLYAMRFLHLADLHLDTPIAGADPEVRARLREATREALVRAVDRALAEDVDAVLIAGDLFDGDRLSFRTERHLTEALDRLVSAGIQVVYATGNHDPGGPSSPADRIPWPEGVIVLSGPEPGRVPVKRGDQTVGWVTGAGHPSARVEEDLSLAFPTPAGELPEVAILHTQVGGAPGAEGHDRYAPSELPRLRGAGYDYWALGHIHRPQELSRHPPIHYAGNIQGRHPGETGPRGGLLVELAPDGSPRVEFVELAPVRWEHLTVEGLEDAAHFDALMARIRKCWTEARAADPAPPGAEWAMRLELRGPSPLFRELQDEENLTELVRRVRIALDLLWAEIRTTGLHPPLDPATHRARPDVVGESLRLLERLRSGDEEHPASALGIAEEDLAGADPQGLDAYIRELLRDQDAHLLATLLREDSET